jgi:hypothetical protein
VIVVGKLDVACFLDDCGAKIFITVDNEEIISILEESEHMALVGKQVLGSRFGHPRLLQKAHYLSKLWTITQIEE